MLLYFAAPLFSSAEKKYNVYLTKQFEEMGITVFLPQRDGVERENLHYKKLSDQEKRKFLFTTDTEKILQCDMFFFLLDGRVPDEGACFELGFAYAQKRLQKKSIIGLHTDSRAAFMKTKLNPMLSQSFDMLFQTEEELLTYLANC